MLPDRLIQIAPDHVLGSVTADGVYDTLNCLDAIAAQGFDRQVAEIQIRAAILNGSTAVCISRADVAG